MKDKFYKANFNWIAGVGVAALFTLVNLISWQAAKHDPSASWITALGILNVLVEVLSVVAAVVCGSFFRKKPTLLNTIPIALSLLPWMFVCLAFIALWKAF